MPNRVASLLLTGFLLAAAAPNANTAATNSTTYAPRQQPALKLEQTRTQQAWGEVLTLQGQYQGAGGSVSLRSTVTKTGAGTAKTPPPGGYAEIDPEQPGDGDPGAGYYYSYSEITHSDGRPLAQAAYEYAAAANRSLLYITLGGVTVALDLNAQEALPVTDAEQARLDEWARSQDALLVDEASVAIIQQGAEQASTELLLNYYAIAMMIDPADGVPTEEGASGPRIRDHKPTGRAAVGLLVRARDAAGDELARPCPPAPFYSLASFNRGSVLIGVPARGLLKPARQSNCFGCCGWGCICIGGRGGAPIYGTPCANHDRCTRYYRNRFARECGTLLAIAIGYVWLRVSPM